MQATQSPASNDPHDVLEIAPDIVLVARAEEELSKLARDAKARAPELPPQPKPGPRLVEDSSVPSIDTGFRATAVNRGRPSRGGRAIRGFFGVLLAVLVGGAVLTLKVSGDVAQQVITSWIPAFAARSEPSDNPAPQEQSAAAAQPAATAAAALPPVQPADATTQNGVASAAPETAAAPDQAQMLQSMAHHLANLRQEVDSLRGQLAELRASQEQMSRDMEKAAEQKDRMKLSALPARPAAPPPPPRRATSTFRPSQAAVAPMTPPPAAYVPPPPQAAQPYTPPQAAPQTAYDPNAPRPPLPVRE